MTGQYFELVANDRPVELWPNISATVDVGVRWPRLLSAPSSALNYSRRSRQTARVIAGGPMNVKCCLLNRVAATRYVDEMR